MNTNNVICEKQEGLKENENENTRLFRSSDIELILLELIKGK